MYVFREDADHTDHETLKMQMRVCAAAEEGTSGYKQYCQLVENIVQRFAESGEDGNQAQQFMLTEKYLGEEFVATLLQRLQAAFQQIAAAEEQSLNIGPLAAKIFAATAKELQARDQQTRELHSKHSAAGKTYRQMLADDQAYGSQTAYGKMLDDDALSCLLDHVNLPDNVGYQIMAMQGHKSAANPRPLTEEQQQQIEEYARIYKKDYVIVLKSQSNFHWHVNVYQQTANKDGTSSSFQAVLTRDADYYSGLNTCGISAVARALQEIAKLIKQYLSPLPRPAAPANQLITAANAILEQHPPISYASKCRATPSSPKDKKTATHNSNQAATTMLRKKPFSRQEIQEAQTLQQQLFSQYKNNQDNNCHQQWRAKFNASSAEVKKQVQNDYQLALQFAIEETKKTGKTRRRTSKL